MEEPFLSELQEQTGAFNEDPLSRLEDQQPATSENGEDHVDMHGRQSSSCLRILCSLFFLLGVDALVIIILFSRNAFYSEVQFCVGFAVFWILSSTMVVSKRDPLSIDVALLNLAVRNLFWTIVIRIRGKGQPLNYVRSWNEFVAFVTSGICLGTIVIRQRSKGKERLVVAKQQKT